MAVHGVPYDSFRGEAVPGVAAAFCQNYGMARSSTFAVGLYGLEHCTLLTNIWIDRMQQLFNIWCRAGSSEEHVFFVEEIVSVGVLPGAGDLATRDVSQRRLGQLLRIVPRR